MSRMDVVQLRERPPSLLLLVLDPRRYRRRVGHLLVAERLLLAGRWTPLVRVRVRQLRYADGGTEL